MGGGEDSAMRLNRYSPAYYAAALLLLFGGPVPAQLSSSAYRLLGQPDFKQNGVNRIQGMEMHLPAAVALDTRAGSLHLYVADSRNNRVLAWRDARSFQAGEAAELILGQPSRQHSSPNGIGTKGFSAPIAMAVDPRNGNLYVADLNGNRVLRFASPFANPTRAEPDAVYGQPNFTSRNANPSGVTSTSMREPRALAFDAAGNLWVADTGNHRVLRFNAAVLESVNPEADIVLGQKDFNSGGANRTGSGVTASGFDTPAGLAVDPMGSLYVSDTGNARVLKFAAPVGAVGAIAVYGQANFTSRGAPPQATSSTLAGPAGLAVDGAGKLYVAVPGDHRIMIYAPYSASGSAATEVLGQLNFTSTGPNAGVSPQASASSLFGAIDVKVDAEGNAYVADAGNNRVLCFPPNSRTASRVWGQATFTSNGANQIKAAGMNTPYKIAIDYSRTPFALYVSDTNNHRVLVWKDAVRFRNGDAADMAIGQPDLLTGAPNVDSRDQKPTATSLFSPRGIAVDNWGNLYVADAGNHRVLRYPRPAGQLGRVAPDVVLGQTDFTTAASAAVSATSLRAPSGVAVSSEGNLYVADTGNHRVLAFPAGAGTGAAAIRVFGQPGFMASANPGTPSAQTLASPLAVFVDAAHHLYVTDSAANRVLVFPNAQYAPDAGAVAAYALGQDRFDTFAAGGGARGFRTPSDVAVDGEGNIFVNDNGNHRVLMFPSLLFLPALGGAATSVAGQNSLTGVAANWNSADGLATPEGLNGPVGICVDRRGTVYVADSGNNRVVHYLKPAEVVNAATFQASVPVAQGSLATLFGAGLADESQTAAPGEPWGNTLAGREVAVNDDLRAPLYYVGPGQVNFQAPWGAPLGASRIAVRMAETGELLAGSARFMVGPASPGFFTASLDGKGQAAVRNQDNTVNGSGNPAAKGSIVSLYGTGQGPVSPAVPDGMPGPSGLLANTLAVPTSDSRVCLTSQPSACVQVGNVFAEIQYSGLAPGLVGVWQLNVRIPPDAPSGAVQVRAIVNGVTSNIVTVAVR
jgi:uncharacterized protein (TIGR03437 family)